MLCSPLAPGLSLGCGERHENLAHLLRPTPQPNSLKVIPASRTFATHSFFLYLCESVFWSRKAGMGENSCPGLYNWVFAEHRGGAGCKRKQNCQRLPFLPHLLALPFHITSEKNHINILQLLVTNNVHVNKWRACVHRAQQIFPVKIFSI